MHIKLEEMFNLNKKVIIITGAAGLLGREHAHAIAAFKGIPVLIDINESGLKKLKEEIFNLYKINSTILVIDITNEAEVKNGAKNLFNKFKKIDCLINNAANNPKMEEFKELNFSRLEKFDKSLWDNDINVALTGSFLCVKYFGALISKNKNGGSIINISSDLGLIAPEQRIYEKKHLKNKDQAVKPITYSVAKAGIIGLTKYISTYWADKNVRCNVLCPGGVKTNQDKEFIKKISKRIPLGRMAKKNEYQSTLIWMLSEYSSYLNGAVITVDGGRTSW